MKNLEPLQGFFKYAVYLLFGDLIFLYFFKKMPATLVNKLLIKNVIKKNIVI